MREPSPRVMAFLIPLGFIGLIGAMIAMAIWPTEVTIALFAIAVVDGLWETYQKKRRGGRRGTEGPSGAGR